MELTISLIGAFTALCGLAISIYGIFHNRFESAHEFLSGVETEAFIKAKKWVYNTKDFDVKDENAAIVVNYFHHWGMLAKHHQLPMWVFDGATGVGLCRLHKILDNYIEKRRVLNKDNSYAECFDWLYHKVKKRLKRKRIAFLSVDNHTD